MLFSQSVYKSASGLHIPSRPFSYNIFNSSLVKATDALGLFPFLCFLSFFCLDCRTFLVFSKTKSLIMQAEWPFFFKCCSKLATKLRSEVGSYSLPSLVRTEMMNWLMHSRIQARSQDFWWGGGGGVRMSASGAKYQAF